MANTHGTEIHLRLALGQNTLYVAERLGLTQRAIQWHRASKCICPEKAALPAAQERRIVDLAGQTPEEQIREMYCVGVAVSEISEYTGVPEAEIVITPEARQELARREMVALGRVAEESPGRWLRLMADRAAVAAMDSTPTGFNPVVVAALVGEIVRRQRVTLPVSEFREWVTWLRELSTSRYSDFVVGFLENAMAAEQVSHEEFVNGAVAEKC